MRTLLFAKRNMKEILRDPINFFFGLGFSLILLLLFTFLNKSIPGNPMFERKNLASGVMIFGTVFMSLFAGMLLAKDRTSSFLTRLFTSPMTSADFILGYTLPMMVMTLGQAVITFTAACFLGLEFNAGVPLAIAAAMPIALLFVGLGLLSGSLMNDKAVGGVCGALLTNLMGWLSGVFIPLDLVGGAFKKTAEVLPFYHGVKAAQAAMDGCYNEIPMHLAVVLGYTVVIYTLAVIVFRHKMGGNSFAEIGSFKE